MLFRSVACTKTGEKKNGLDIWMWKYDGDKTELPAKIIFNNNSNGRRRRHYRSCEVYGERL